MNKRFLLISVLILFWGITQSTAQDCNITSKANDILPDKLCAPVSLTWEVTYRGVNDAGMTVEIQVNWDDGNAIEIETASNTNVALQEWKYTFSHVYPIGGNKCNYQPEASLVIGGTVCTSSIQVQNVTVWDTDNYNGGVLEIDPPVFPICVGNADGTVFTDASIWNCTPAGGENDNINGKTRWTQWVYGTNSSAVNFISNATVGGSSQSYPYWDNVVEAPEYVDAPQAPNNVSQYCFSPLGPQVGDEFEITLRNWNYCNPYDDPSIAGPPSDLVNGDFPPIEITAIILIVDTPQTHLDPAGPFCANNGQVWLNGTPGGGVWNGDGVNNSGQFRPWVAGPGIHTITYTTTDPTYGCDGTATIQIEVYAIPDPNLGPNQEVCPGDIIFLDGNPTTGDGNIISHLWSGDTTPLSATNIVNPSFTTTTQGLYNLNYTVSDDNGCSNTESIAINVNPANAHIIPDPAEVCVGEDLILNGNPSGGTGNYITHVWTGDVANLDVTNTQSVTFNSTVIGTYNYTYTVTDDNGCTGTDNAIVTVFENPIADAGLNDSVCGLLINLAANPSIGTGTWSEFSGPGSISFDNNHSATAQATADQYGLYQLIWSETYGPSCIDQDTIEIRFTEQPIADAGPDGGICGYTYQLESVPSVGNGYWTVFSGTGNITFSDSTLFDTYVTSDTYTNYELIWHEDNGYGCTDEDHVLVSFNLVPTPAFNPINPDGCTPFTVDFSNQSTGGTDYTWSFGNGNTTTVENPSETFYNSTNGDLTYNVTLIVNNPGCGDTLVQTVTVHPAPNANFSNNGIPQCSPSSVDFVNSSVGSTMHIWNWDDGSPLDTANTISHTFVNDTVFIVNYAVTLYAVTSFGCVDSTVDYITVYPNPNYEIIATPDSSCHPATVDFSTSPSGQTYSWDFGNGTSEIGSYLAQSNYTNLSNNNVSYNVQLIVSSYFGCTDTANTQIVVHPTPNVDFNIPVSSGCAPFDANFINISTGATSYYWDFGDGTLDTNLLSNISHTYENNTANPITYYINLRGENDYGCEDIMQKTILVYPEMNIEFTADTIACNPFSNQMVNLSSGATTYLWDFGDGQSSNLSSPLHIYYNNSYQNELVYTTILIGNSTYGCSDSDTLEIKVLPTPFANFALQGESGCTPYLQIITNTSVGGDNHFWSFGDGDTLNSSEINISHEYINNQAISSLFDIDLEVTNVFGCSAQHHKNIEVYPKVTALFTSDTAGCSPLPIDFINQSSGATSYFWDFDNGLSRSEQNPSYTFENTNINHDTLLIQLIARSDYNCLDTALRQIIIYATPTAAFDVQPPQQNYPNTVFALANQSGNGNWQYHWDFGDGQTETLQQPNTHSYNTWGDYDIWLKVFNEFCSDSIKKSVKIIAPEPTADFNFSPKSGCVPLKVTLTNLSLNAENYFWDFGDGYTSEAFEPIHVYYDEGIYYIKLTVTGENGSNEIILGPIHVYPTPEAHFEVSPEIVYIPEQPIKCFNLSIGADSVLWNFGDNITSTEENPLHYYQEEGSYDITLIAMTENMCMDTAYLPQAVEAKSEGKIDFPNAFKPSASGSNGGKYPIPDTENQVFHPVFRGVTDYELNIFNRWGELIFVSNSIDIGWDGYYRGELSKQDVYVWKVTGKYINGKQFQFAGDVTLIR